MAIPQIPQVDRNQAITDMIEAIALQEAAVASLIHAESAKVDALIAAGIPAAASTADVESFQAAVANVLNLANDRQQASNERLALLKEILMLHQQKPE